MELSSTGYLAHSSLIILTCMFATTCTQHNVHPAGLNSTEKDSCFYGMGIESAWKMGCRGKGVVVAIINSGIEMQHVSLAGRTNETLSYNFLLNVRDGSPRQQKLSKYNVCSHGTESAGLIVSNGNGPCACASGVAPETMLASLIVMDEHKYIDRRLISSALSYENNAIDIYSYSLKTSNSDCGFENLSVFESDAFTTKLFGGRHGKGNLFILPAGNGGQQDHCNPDPFANNLQALRIGSVGRDGKVAHLAEPCPNVFAAALSEGGTINATELLTTSINNSCTKQFNGSAAATALATGIFALVLEASPNLSKRDIEHLVVETSAIEGLDASADWIINGASIPVSSYFGFGLLDAGAMVKRARTWAPIPEQIMCRKRVDVADAAFVSFGNVKKIRQVLVIDKCAVLNIEITSLEYVQLELNFKTSAIDDTHIELTSPMGTTSKMLTQRVDKCSSIEHTVYWNFTSVQFWGENPTGKWIIHISTVYVGPTTSLSEDFKASLIMRGINSKLLKYTLKPTEKKNVIPFGIVIGILGVAFVSEFFLVRWLQVQHDKKKEHDVAEFEKIEFHS